MGKQYIFNLECLQQQPLKMQNNSQYLHIRTIGKGSFGQVELVQSKKDQKRFVIKKMQISSQNKDCVAKQVSIMKQLKHQYITRYYQNFIDTQGRMCIVMEYAENGQLQNYLNKRKNQSKPLSQDEVLQWFIQLCMGIKYIHDHRILHRDLKCQNIFISNQKEIKIGDFGISKLMHETFDMAKTKIGTPYVMAPQIWENKMYNQKSDLWSLGCILYKMMTLNHAFQAKNPGAYVMKITSGKYNPITGNFSSQLKSLVQQMLSLQPQNRPSVHGILQRKFIKDRVQNILNNSIDKFKENLLLENKLSLKLSAKCSKQILSKRKSSISLSQNSSFILTPTNVNIFDNTKIIQMKQSYPILMQQAKQLKIQLSKSQQQKEQFVEACQKMIQSIKAIQQNSQAKQSVQIRDYINKLEYKLSSYLYP